jgi:hypothetical protein
MIENLVNSGTAGKNSTDSDQQIYVIAFPSSVFESAAQFQKQINLDDYFKRIKAEKRKTGIFYNICRFIYVGLTYK